MKMFKKYEAATGFRYHMRPHCIFCGCKTDRMVEYGYHGFELDEREFPIPVHPFCFLRRKLGIWVGSISLFAVILLGAAQLELWLFNAAPYWIVILNCFPAIAIAGYWGLRRFTAFEHEIAMYKRSHTDYEDYYKSDRRRRAGFENW